MIEWLYEAGIGEARAALIEDGAIVAARIAIDGAIQLGCVADARLLDGDGRIALGGGGEALLGSVPKGLSIGRMLRVTITREAIPEPGRAKLAGAMAAGEGASLTPGPSLWERIGATGHPVRICHAHDTDHLEAAGWSEVLDEAITGEIAFAGGALRMTPTPAMTLFDVDGSGAIDALAVAAARAIARAIMRHDIGGSIGIDFPSVQGRGIRQAVASAIDAALPQPFERTALNVFGFLQIVRPRPRASLPELLRADPIGAHARAALRQIERTPPGASRRHRVGAPVRSWLEARPELLDALARRMGGAIMLED